MVDKITVSWSEVQKRRQCGHAHDLTYKQRWVGKTTSPSLLRGTLMHKLWEGHYRSLMERPGDLVTARVEARRWWNEWKEDAGDEIAELVWWVYDGYTDLYGADDHLDIRAVEQKLEVPLLTASGQRSRFVLKMQIDLIVRDRTMGNKLFIYDHKTGADLPTRKNLDMADQFGLYTWGMRQLGHDVFASVWNAARTRRLKTKETPLADRFSRPMMSRTDHELDTIAREAYATVRKAYASNDLAERSPSDDCSWKCGFLEACLLGRKTNDDRERQFLLDTGFVVDATRH